MSPFLAGCAWLLVFQCLGEVAGRLVGGSVPGPVIGMALLFVALLARPALPDALSQAADALAKHLSLLFVPAGVGVMLYAKQLASEWIPIAAALVISTGLALVTSALVFRWLAHRSAPRDDAGRPS